MHPQFSIVTITRNDVAGLRATARSVLEQNHADREWVVVDGASTDGSVDFLRSLEPGQANWSSAPDDGIYDAMNRGLDRVSGKYVWFMNAGDTFAAPDTLTLVANAMTDTPDVCLLYGDAIERRPDGIEQERPARDASWLPNGMFTHHQAMAFSRSAIGGLRYDTTFRLSGDYAFIAQLLRSPGCRTLRIRAPLCVFRLDGASQTRRREAIREDRRVRSEILALHPVRVSALSLGHRVHRLVKSRFPTLMARVRDRAGRP